MAMTSVEHMNNVSSSVAESLAHVRRAVGLQSELDLTCNNDSVYSTLAATSGAEPWVEIIEQPKSTAMRFRYVCEGRSAGTILGVKATAAQKTYPTIRIHNGGSAAVVVVSCVTKDPPHYPHPHSLVGSSCKEGVCTLRAKGVNTISMMNVGVQCCKRNGVSDAIGARQKIRVDPFATGYVTELEKLDLSAVRLCFQVFLLDSSKKFSQVVPPVVSDPIVDKKLVHNLNICRLSRRTCSAKGGDEILLLCDKIKKDDIEVRFYEEDDEGELIWQAFGSFSAADIHHQCAITFKAPAFRLRDVMSPVSVQIQLRRPSDDTLGQPKDFQYIPNGLDDDEPMFASKRKKLRLDHQIVSQPSAEYEVAASTINGDGVLAIQHATAHPSSSSSAYSQVPLSVVETAAGGTGNIEAAMPSQDVPVDFSVPSRSVSLQSTDASLYDSNDLQPKDEQQQVTVGAQESNVSQPILYLPATELPMQGGAILLHLTEDGKLILPPGVATTEIQPQNSFSAEQTTLQQAL